MSEQHLTDLLNGLQGIHWTFVEELPGDDYRYSGYWIVARPDGSRQLTLKFHGMSKCGDFCHPMDGAYACDIAEFPGIGVYFGSATEAWKNRLATFIEEVRRLPD